MNRFFEKYIAYFNEEDAIKIIHKRLHRAKKLAENQDVKHLEELKLVHDMIQDYLEVKAVK